MAESEPEGSLLKRKALTLQEWFYIAMILWVASSILVVIFNLIVAGIKLSKGDLNVTIPISVGLTIPLG
ncbi:hypothetical protein EYM_00570 [Ignicoccus islandicus DSM 13165]|uniref:Uncharacterized protein n=1 Tax=Ignicoccus islandicus DSM 13165 TaxID=940295 RepID=A0A0U3F7W4_9CREN|nr:hypothetical protein EYM_00570 [Ignicoccus islandicus DSM 13165]